VGRTSTRALIIVAGLGVAGCGGRSARVDPSEADPLEVTSFPPVACTEERDERPLVADARFATLATGVDLRVESVEGNDGLVAYTVAEPGTERRSLFVVPAMTGEPPTLVASGLSRTDETSELVIRFEESTLVVLTGIVNDVAEELLVWRAGDAGLASIARVVDPTAVRASRDGRFLSVEADDRRQDQKQTVTLLLVDLADLSVTVVGDLDQPRARFTRDSSALVFSGVTGNPTCANVKRLSLEDASVTDVVCASPQARWEITPDGSWLLHGLELAEPSLECPLLLARSGVLDATTLTHDECLLPGSDKELDVSDGGRRLAFLSPPADRSLGGAALRVKSMDDEDTVELVPDGQLGIIDHFEDTIAFRAEGDDECDDDRLMSIPSWGGTVSELGLFTSRCSPSRKRAPVLDHDDGALLALSPDGTLRFQPQPGVEPILLACGAGGAALSTRSIAVFSAPYQGGMGLFRYDHTTREVRALEPVVTGPFVLTPRKESWLAVTVPDADGTAIVADHR
jgi:hypothetical protein